MKTVNKNNLTKSVIKHSRPASPVKKVAPSAKVNKSQVKPAGELPVEIKDTTKPKVKQAHSFLPRNWFLFFDLGLREAKEGFLDNLTLLLSAGMDLLSAIEAIKSEVRSWRMRKLLDLLKEEIDSGITLWEAMRRARVFSEQAISLIKVGEQSGRLVENLKVVTMQQQKERMFNSKIRSAMMYPGFVLFVTVVVGLGIAWLVLPKLSNVFNSLDVELPLITQLLIQFGNFISLYGKVVVPATLAVLMLLLYFLFVFRPTRALGQFISMNTPGIKKLVQQSEVARFGYIMGSLLDAGMPLLYAIESLRQSTNFRAYRKFYAYLGKSLEDGNSFKNSFFGYYSVNKLVPKSIQQLIIAGEQSGSLSKSLIKVGEIYEEKIEITTKNLSVILEPMLLFIVWLGVLGVAIAIILPIYSLVGSFNH
ncbi:MAG: type II secretion system F family protein [Patescibacteria group bacterium]